VFGGLAGGVEVPVEACDVVGILECGAFGGAWRAGDPCADRDMAGVDTPVGQCTSDRAGVQKLLPAQYAPAPPHPH